MKKFITLAILFCMLIISSVNAATYATTKVGSKGEYSVRTTAYWDYETGKYSTRGPHTVISKPKNTYLTLYYMDFLTQHVDSDRHGVTHYFEGFSIDGFTGLRSRLALIEIYLTTKGPM